MQRIIMPEEQTKLDGTVVRIERHRLLKGSYLSASGTERSFSIELESAVNSIVGAAGLALAANLLILGF